MIFVESELLGDVEGSVLRIVKDSDILMGHRCLRKDGYLKLTELGRADGFNFPAQCIF